MHILIMFKAVESSGKPSFGIVFNICQTNLKYQFFSREHLLSSSQTFLAIAMFVVNETIPNDNYNNIG